MNSTTLSTKKIRVIMSALTTSELEALEERIQGYGWLVDSARKADLHVNTIRNVIRRGYGTPDVVTKIRNILLA